MNLQSDQLAVIVQEVAEAVLASTDTVDRLSQRMDALVEQVQQQGYQIFALSDAVQAIAEVQEASLQRLDRLTEALERLVNMIEQPPGDPPTS